MTEKNNICRKLKGIKRKRELTYYNFLIEKYRLVINST